MRGLGLGLAVLLVVPTVASTASGEGSGPATPCHIEAAPGARLWGAVVAVNDTVGIYSLEPIAYINDTANNLSFAPLRVALLDCSYEIPRPIQATPDSRNALEPLSIEFVSGAWVAPGVYQVTWRTNNPSMGRLWWGPVGGGVTGYAEDGAFSEVHFQRISSLEPGATYEFQAAAIGRDSGYLISQPLQAAPPPPARIAVDVGAAAAFAAAAGAAMTALRLRTAHRR